MLLAMNKLSKVAVLLAKCVRRDQPGQRGIDHLPPCNADPSLLGLSAPTPQYPPVLPCQIRATRNGRHKFCRRVFAGKGNNLWKRGREMIVTELWGKYRNQLLSLAEKVEENLQFWLTCLWVWIVDCCGFIFYFFFLREGITVSLFIQYCTLSTVCAMFLMLFWGGVVYFFLNVLFTDLQGIFKPDKRRK